MSIVIKRTIILSTMLKAMEHCLLRHLLNILKLKMKRLRLSLIQIQKIRLRYDVTRSRVGEFARPGGPALLMKISI